jgi:hypothetical protein
MPFFYVSLMSTRFFQSNRIDELREALSDAPETSQSNVVPLDRG